jgi:subtilase family serine protease
VRGAGAILLNGNHTAPGLAPGASHSGTVTVTIPTTVSPETYYLLACADDQLAILENNELNNCIASTAPIVTVTRPDLVATAVSAPPATAARGSKFPVTDTAHNAGEVVAALSKTRYYASPDQAKSADDKLLTGSRTVPVLAAAASHSGAVTVAIPNGIPPGTYYLLACVDDTLAVAETSEANNCRASATTMTIMP